MVSGGEIVLTQDYMPYGEVLASAGAGVSKGEGNDYLMKYPLKKEEEFVNMHAQKVHDFPRQMAYYTNINQLDRPLVGSQRVRQLKTGVLRAR